MSDETFDPRELAAWLVKRRSCITTRDPCPNQCGITSDRCDECIVRMVDAVLRHHPKGLRRFRLVETVVEGSAFWMKLRCPIASVERVVQTMFDDGRLQKVRHKLVRRQA